MRASLHAEMIQRMIRTQLAEMQPPLPFFMVFGAPCRAPSLPSRSIAVFGVVARFCAPDGPARALLAARAQDGGARHHPR